MTLGIFSIPLVVAAYEQELSGDIEITDEPSAEGSVAESGDSEFQTSGDNEDEEQKDDESNAEIEQDADTIYKEVLPDGSEEAQELLQEPLQELLQEPQQDVVYTEAELNKWCEDNRTSGGRVTLGDTITITEGIWAHGCENIVIDTGSYGLVYGGSAIYMYSTDKLEIIGEGVDVPVLDISDMGWSPFGDSWNLTTQNLYITSTGRDGAGGIALRVLQQDSYAVNTSGFMTEGQIRSYGTGAVGLYLAVPLDVYCFNIEVYGENSVAVYAEQGANLYFCKIKAQGAGASAVSGSAKFVLDTCAAVPEPQNARIINRTITGIVSGRLYQPVEQYTAGIYCDSLFTFLLSGGDGYEAVYADIHLDWGDSFDNIDTSVLGRTEILCQLAPPFQGLGLEDGFPINFVIDVKDPSLPCIYNMIFMGDALSGKCVYFYFWDSFERGDDDIILWRSDDGGKSWYNFTDPPEIDWWNRGSLTYYFNEIIAPVMFQLELLGTGESNIVTLYPIDGSVAVGNLGGDRDGGDRVVTQKPGNGHTDEDGDNPGSGNTSDNGNTSGGGSAPYGNNTSDSENIPSVEIIHDNEPIPAGDFELETNQPEQNRSAQLWQFVNAFLLFNMQNRSITTEVLADAPEQTAANETKITEEPREWEDENTVVLSGRRLSAMIDANPETVTFVKNDVQVSVTSDALRALELGERQLLRVTIKKLSENSFSVMLEAGQTGAVQLPFVVNIGEKTFGDILLTSVVCLDERNDVLPSEYNSSTGKLSISAHCSGVFTLEAQQRPETAVAASAQEDTVAPIVEDIPPINTLPTEIEPLEQAEYQTKQSLPLSTGIIYLMLGAISLSVGGVIWIKRRLIKR